MRFLVVRVYDSPLKIAGRVMGGTLKVGDRIVFATGCPLKATRNKRQGLGPRVYHAEVVSMEMFHRPVNSAVAGQCVALRLKFLDNETGQPLTQSPGNTRKEEMKRCESSSQAATVPHSLRHRGFRILIFSFDFYEMMVFLFFYSVGMSRSSW